MIGGSINEKDKEKIKNRFVEYNEKTAPLIAYYKAQGKYHAVDGIGTVEEITVRLSKAIDQIKAQ